MLKKIQGVLCGVGLALLSLSVGAQEQAVLTTPVSTTQYQVRELLLRWIPPESCYIGIVLVDNNEVALRHVYQGATACTLLIALNKANLSTSSLQRRIMERLITDKVIVGTVTGTPE